ncbi:MAG: hypothetical protein SRB2_03938 [Desulfobacteraceae bacterium Eth-SRB2]|nr:MAG: hypothetical protein SRB2_03938 [Desulfobacteraceae bacterium Eth-SRB2]
MGIDAGSGIMKTSEKMIEAYNLDFKLLASSGPAMTASLASWVRICGALGDSLVCDIWALLQAYGSAVLQSLL